MANGPSITDVIITGISIIGFFRIFDICSIDVPNPCEINPPQPLSLKLATAKPIMCAEHPTVAAPAASPPRDSEMAMAALLIGSVRSIPIVKDSMIPIQNGWRVVALFIPSPINCMNWAM